MELMSSLLLCALATLVPQALGKNSTTATAINGTDVIERTNLINKGQIVTIKLPATSNKLSDLKSVFMDASCKKCYNCMERAIKSHRVHNHIDLIKGEKIHNELVNQEINTRKKRKTNAIAQKKNDKKTKKSKAKNNKSVNIIKYNDNDRVYALKIMETNKQVLSDQHTNKTTCQVFSVKKSFPCESPEADLILKESKTKINKNKKSKREQSKKSVSDTKTTVITPVFRKRQIDDSEAPEQIMPSVEEIY